ncbi:hypothetical protein A2773_05545 [Candidatus Gottesmanbacteria bacterium RIFCSPHIGHO2_01_FULL_39_10]|uniref:RNase H type-1 domain-containing protein n=1 Tax=Candidatus Gottesmanbacteria bacterium RIFCSPHIGHO2_01_FULL_39_10 TaxID=1798375 RepID=A0A1F5ZQA4_9BACT|nr:MAG: hypothetical protein A2773_05545 [Candidatus Gottesmanbacteria bacterium RIFCSPHIGHO2_01_FULL_39_10]
MNLSIFTDGGARGNPGPAAVGVVVKDDKGNKIKEIGKKIGVATNNFAEYTAVVEALESVRGEALSVKVERINFFLDSSLVVNQLNGLFKVKNGDIRNFIVKIRELEQEAGGNISYSYIPREKNWEADKLVNQALDNS